MQRQMFHHFMLLTQPWYLYPFIMLHTFISPFLYYIFIDLLYSFLNYYILLHSYQEINRFIVVEVPSTGVLLTINFATGNLLSSQSMLHTGVTLWPIVIIKSHETFRKQPQNMFVTPCNNSSMLSTHIAPLFVFIMYVCAATHDFCNLFKKGDLHAPWKYASRVFYSNRLCISSVNNSYKYIVNSRPRQL